MNKPVLVQKVNSSDGLDEEVEGFVFSQHVFVSSADDMKQVALLHMFQNQVDRFFVLQRRVEPHYVLML